MSSAEWGKDQARLKGHCFEMPEAGDAKHACEIADRGVTLKLGGEGALALLEICKRAISDQPIGMPTTGAAFDNDMWRRFGVENWLKRRTVEIDKVRTDLLDVVVCASFQIALIDHHKDAVAVLVELSELPLQFGVGAVAD